MAEAIYVLAAVISAFHDPFLPRLGWPDATPHFLPWG